MNLKTVQWMKKIWYIYPIETSEPLKEQHSITFKNIDRIGKYSDKLDKRYK